MNIKLVKDAFLQGLCPLEALVERPVRPGSTENLIWPEHPNPFVLHFGQEVALSREQLADMQVQVGKVIGQVFADAAKERVKQATRVPIEREPERHGAT